MELTINEIKQKQKELKIELNKALNKFHQETGLEVRGEINFGYTENIHQQWTKLKFSNPFEKI